MAVPTNFLLKNETAGLVIIPTKTGGEQVFAVGEQAASSIYSKLNFVPPLSNLGSCDADGVLDDPQKTDPATSDVAFPRAISVSRARSAEAERSISGKAGSGWKFVSSDGDASGLSMTSAIVAGKLDVAIAGTEGAKAQLLDQNITYQAVAEGEAGNAITITLVDPQAAHPATTFAAVGNDITITLRNTTGSAVDATATNLVSDFGSAPSGVTDLITVAGSGGSNLSELVETALSGGTSTSDFLTVTASRTEIVYPTVTGNSVSVGAGELVITKNERSYTAVITDGTSGKIATFESNAWSV